MTDKKKEVNCHLARTQKNLVHIQPCIHCNLLVYQCILRLILTSTNTPASNFYKHLCCVPGWYCHHATLNTKNRVSNVEISGMVQFFTPYWRLRPALKVYQCSRFSKNCRLAGGEQRKLTSSVLSRRRKAVVWGAGGV